MKRSYGSIRKLTNTGNNLSLSLPKEVSLLLINAGIEAVSVRLTDEGILLIPVRDGYTPPEQMPEWAKTDG